MLLEFQELPDVIRGIITDFQGDEDLKRTSEKNLQLSIPVVLFLFSHSIPTGAEKWAELFVANSNSTNFGVDRNGLILKKYIFFKVKNLKQGLRKNVELNWKRS